MKKDIEAAVRARSYQSPGRARAAITRSHLPARKKARLSELVDVWEGEGEGDGSEAPVVGGLPEADVRANGSAREAEVLEAPRAMGLPIRLSPESKLDMPRRLNLNALIRVRLTPYGFTLLYAARERGLALPEQLLERGGVWETELWHFMFAVGPALHTDMPDVPTVGNVIEVLDPGTTEP